MLPRRISRRAGAAVPLALVIALVGAQANQSSQQHPAAAALPQPPAATPTLSSGVRIQPPSPGHVPPVGQAARYSGEWHLMSAGTATLTMQSSGGSHTTVMLADSAGMVNMIYPVHDRRESSFDPRTFCSLTLKKHVEEGSRRRDALVHYDYAHGQSVMDEKDLRSGELKHLTHAIPSCVTDTTSGFYYLASLPLKIGAVYNFPVNDGGETSEVAARVEAEEALKVPAGSYRTVRVAVQAQSGPFSGKGKLWAWYTEDAQHLLVQMRAKVKWGTVSFRLTRLDRQ